MYQKHYRSSFITMDIKDNEQNCTDHLDWISRSNRRETARDCGTLFKIKIRICQENQKQNF